MSTEFKKSNFIHCSWNVISILLYNEKMDLLSSWNFCVLVIKSVWLLHPSILCIKIIVRLDAIHKRKSVNMYKSTLET